MPSTGGKSQGKIVDCQRPGIGLSVAAPRNRALLLERERFYVGRRAGQDDIDGDRRDEAGVIAVMQRPGRDVMEFAWSESPNRSILHRDLGMAGHHADEMRPATDMHFIRSRGALIRLIGA